jgi:hypothetical protein
MFAASSSVRGVVLFASVVLGVLVATSCSDGSYYERRSCDYTMTRCGTVCDDWCDSWGCWPTCWDQCWNDCSTEPSRPPLPPPSATAVRDGGAPATTPRTDGGRSGAGVLCSTCTANDECENGALCIFRGGRAPDGGAPSKAGFCGHSCTNGGCPDGFTCAQLGSSKQCLPNAGTCP